VRYTPIPYLDYTDQAGDITYVCVCFYLNVCSFLEYRCVYVLTVGLDLTGKYINVTLMPSRLYHSLGRGTVVREVRRNKNATFEAKVCYRQDLSF
jgi:hypothetical protein